MSSTLCLCLFCVAVCAPWKFQTLCQCACAVWFLTSGVMYRLGKASSFLVMYKCESHSHVCLYGTLCVMVLPSVDSDCGAGTGAAIASSPLPARCSLPAKTHTVVPPALFCQDQWFQQPWKCFTRGIFPLLKQHRLLLVCHLRCNLCILCLAMGAIRCILDQVSVLRM